MNKHEFEIKKAIIGAQKFEAIIGLIKHFVTLATVVFALKIVFEGIQPFIGQSPETIEAFGKLINAINLTNITGYIVGTVAVVGWKLERTGKKRAIRQKSELQEKLEASDKYRSSSGLTDTGDTPKE